MNTNLVAITNSELPKSTPDYIHKLAIAIHKASIEGKAAADVNRLANAYTALGSDSTSAEYARAAIMGAFDNADIHAAGYKTVAAFAAEELNASSAKYHQLADVGSRLVIPAMNGDGDAANVIALGLSCDALYETRGMSPSECAELMRSGVLRPGNGAEVRKVCSEVRRARKTELNAAKAAGREYTEPPVVAEILNAENSAIAVKIADQHKEDAAKKTATGNNRKVLEAVTIYVGVRTVSGVDTRPFVSTALENMGMEFVAEAAKNIHLYWAGRCYVIVQYERYTAPGPEIKRREAILAALERLKSGEIEPDQYAADIEAVLTAPAVDLEYNVPSIDWDAVRSGLAEFSGASGQV